MGRGAYTSTIVREIPRKRIWWPFKAMCAEEGKSLNKKIKELIEDYVKAHSKG